MEHVITALKIQKNNPQRLNVFVDGEFGFGIARHVGAWLEVGQVLTTERIVTLKSEDEFEIAYQRAIHFLSFRDRSSEEICQALARKGTDETIIQQVVGRLRESEIIDDKRFANNWVENRNEFRPRGKALLTFELKRKGISNQDIEQAITEVDEFQLAYDAAQKIASKLAKLDWHPFRKKVYEHLARRGFNYEIISQVTDRIWTERTSIKSNKPSKEVDI